LLNKQFKPTADSIDPWASAAGESVHKKRPQSGGEEVVQCGQGRREVLQMRTSALFDAKNVESFEINGVSARN